MRFHFIAVAVCALAVTLSGCSLLGIETCSMGTTRCHGNEVQICKMGLGWSDSISCDEVSAAEGGKWTCAAPKGVCQESFQCMPEKSESREKGEPKGDKPDKDKSEKPEKKESPRGSR